MVQQCDVIPAELRWVPDELVVKVKTVMSWLQVRLPRNGARWGSQALDAKFADDAAGYLAHRV